VLESAVSSPVDSQFMHLARNDGTFESICKQCFYTVARVDLEADLLTPEAAHLCNPWTRSPDWRRAIQNYFGP